MLRTALLNEDWEGVENNVTVAKSVKEWTKGTKLKVEGARVYFEGKELPSDLTSRILAMVREGKNPEALSLFWQRLSKNPSWRSVNQLWSFLQHQNIPITKDGYILAYKSVKSNYTDVHSGTFDNSPGRTNEMPRNEISDDPNQSCHEGFHVGALSYAQGFSGSRIVVCKIDPEDVVCIPYDSSSQKMRVCKYEVIGNHGMPLPSTTFDEQIEDAPEEGADDVDVTPAEPRTPVAAKPTATTHKKEIKRSKTFKKYDDMNIAKLMELSIMDLRQYAFKGLNIIGASKIPGGKTALVERILNAREGMK